MNSEKLYDAVGEIRDDLIADAHSGAEKKRSHLAGWAAAAACLCIIAGAVFIGGGKEAPISPVESVDRYYYVPTADFAASVFDAETKWDGGRGTKQYTRVYAPDVSELAPEEFTAPAELNIYKLSAQSPDAGAAEAFFVSHLPEFHELCGMSAYDHELCEEDWDGETVYTAFVQEMTGDGGFKLIMLSARSGDMCIYSGASERMSFDGELVHILSAAGDAEIKSALRSFAAKLNTLFGTDHTDMHIKREYSDEGLRTVTVSLCADPKSDRIEMTFNTDWGEGRAYHWGEDRTNAYLTSIALHEVKEESTTVGFCRALTLEEAEEQLRQGFVFGGHSCPLCMAAQSEVDFEDYDAVALEYVSGGGYSVPFYAFYKELGVNGHGMTEFAKTYVCAVELDGAEEYFNSQSAYHDANIPAEGVKGLP